MAQQVLAQSMGIAVGHLLAGRLDETERVLRDVLAREPNFADGLQLLGIVALQKGGLDQGIELIRRAIAIRSGKRRLPQQSGRRAA